MALAHGSQKRKEVRGSRARLPYCRVGHAQPFGTGFKFAPYLLQGRSEGSVKGTDKLIKGEDLATTRLPNMPLQASWSLPRGLQGFDDTVIYSKQGR